MKRLPLLLAPLAMLILAGCGMPIRDIEAENRAIPWTGRVAACDDSGVLGSISGRFSGTEARYWGNDIAIVRFEHVRETSFRKNGRAYIPRRGCTATVVLSNNARTTLSYTVVEQAGVLSLGDRVEYCVAGYDRHHLAPPACARATR